MKSEPDPTELDRLLQYLSEKERAEFLQLYYRVFQHTNPNDEMITLFRSMYFGYLLIAKVPERMATERERLHKIATNLMPKVEAAVNNVAMRIDEQAKLLDEQRQGLKCRLIELSEVGQGFVDHANWVRSSDGIQKQSRDIAAQLVPILNLHLDRLNGSAADMKAESLNLAVQTYAREETLLARIAALEKATLAQNRVRQIGLSFWSAGIASAILLVLGFLGGTALSH